MIHVHVFPLGLYGTLFLFRTTSRTDAVLFQFNC